MIKLYKKYQEIINYLIAGGLTVLVTILSYAFFTKILNIYYIVSNVLSWIVAVIFAYVVNRKFVFKSKSIKKEQIKEITNFLIGRLLSLLVDTLLSKQENQQWQSEKIKYEYKIGIVTDEDVSKPDLTQYTLQQQEPRNCKFISINLANFGSNISKFFNN